jgi:hypothetical protein
MGKTAALIGLLCVVLGAGILFSRWNRDFAGLTDRADAVSDRSDVQKLFGNREKVA